jgi:ABC-2 type transport system ATP-binding protein
MCENIILINHGKNILEGIVHEIRNKYKEHLYKITYQGELPKVFTGGLELIHTEDHSATFKIPNQASPNELLQYLINAGCQVHSFHEILPSINEIFIRQVKGISHE